MRFKLFMEMFGSFDYEPPVDKEQQLYDFYMLNLLKGTSSYTKKFIQHGLYSSSPPKPNFKGDMDEEDKIDYMLQEVANNLLPILKKNMLEAVLFALSSEFNHILMENYPDELIGILERKKMPDSYIRMFKKYVELEKDSPLLYDQKDQWIKNPEIRDDKINRVSRYLPVLMASENNHDAFVYIMRELFKDNHVDWVANYGGKAWALIADGWLRLNNAKTEKDIIIAIDHIYDLQHNTGSVFSKLQSYYKGNRTIWLDNALNFKAKIKNPYEIINRVSPSLRQLAIRAIKKKTGQSIEEFKQYDKSPYQALEQALKEKRRLPEYEHIIAQNSKTSFSYAINILHDRFKLGEQSIAEDPITSLAYAERVIKGRFKEGEKVMKSKPAIWNQYATFAGLSVYD